MTSALNLSVYSVSGTDANRFLQGQLTQDIDSLQQQWRYAAHCNPKGRVISLYISFALDEQYYLITPTNLAEEAIQQIRKYIMRSDVNITQTAQSIEFKPSNDWQHDNNLKIEESGQIALNIVNQGQLLINDKQPTLKADSNREESTTPNWHQARIATGVPQLHPETIGLFTPESLNLDLTEAVSFSKGCYTGQEIVARMHYLGKAKQRLFTASLAANTPLRPNMPVTDEQAKTVGYIIDIAPNEQQKTMLLVSLKVEKIQEPLFVAQTPLTVEI